MTRRNRKTALECAIVRILQDEGSWMQRDDLFTPLVLQLGLDGFTVRQFDAAMGALKRRREVFHDSTRYIYVPEERRGWVLTVLRHAHKSITSRLAAPDWDAWEKNNRRLILSAYERLQPYAAEVGCRLTMEEQEGSGPVFHVWRDDCHVASTSNRHELRGFFRGALAAIEWSEE